MRVVKPAIPSSTPPATDDSPPDQQITVRPPYDPQDFAHQSERPTVRAAEGQPLASAFRERAPARDAPIPVLAVSRDDLAWFDLPAAARALLDRVDGESPIEIICIRAGIPLAEGADALDELARQGLVARK